MSTLPAALSQAFALRVPKPWGYEVLLTPQGFPYAAKLLFVESGARLSLQVHTEKTETLCLVRGRALLLLEGEDGCDCTTEMVQQMGYSIPSGRRHRITGLEDAVLFEASTPELGATLRLEDDYRRSDEVLGGPR
jgi:mannose-6-phosphate isomerase